MPAKSKHSHKSGSLHKSASRSTTPAASKSRPATGSSTSRLKSRRRGGGSTLGLILLLVVIVIVAVIYFSTRGSTSQGLAAEISAAQAYEKYQGGAFFLDVREQSEWDAGYIPNTTHIPLGELESRLGELPQDQEIVVVCRSGNRSAEGRDLLLQNGFSDVTSMAGGVRDWGNAGYPFEGAIP